jgi:hypothetical protein
MNRRTDMTQNKLRSLIAFLASTTLALVCVQQAASVTLPSVTLPSGTIAARPVA